MNMEFFKMHFTLINKSCAMITERLESECKQAMENQIILKTEKEEFLKPEKQKKKKKKSKKETKDDDDTFLESILQNQKNDSKETFKIWKNWLKLQKSYGNKEQIYGNQLVNFKKLEEKLAQTGDE